MALLAIVITTDATGHGFVDGNNRGGGVVAAKPLSLTDLRCMGISLSRAALKRFFLTQR